MAFQPVPLEQKSGTPNALFAPVPVDYSTTPTPTPPVLAALIAAGFGSAGDVLATNSEGDGFEWITP